MNYKLQVNKPILVHVSIIYKNTVYIILDLPGVEVIASTSVVVTNSFQSFYWKGYGFRLYIPPGSLPDDVAQCVLHISISFAGQYQLPNGQELVSAVFWVHPDPPCLFKQNLKLEIQYCVKITSSTKLTFVRAVCSQESLPYIFKKLEGQGSFSRQSAYGCLEVNHFSGLGITAEEDVDKSYIASLWYKCRNPRLLELYFVITWDYEAHITVSVLCLMHQLFNIASPLCVGNKKIF